MGTWIPEIMYEESEEGSSNIPFIMVPENETMPKMLFIFESSATGEEEPGIDGEDVPVYQWDLHQYADMLVLKENLDVDTYDMVRAALGLEPLVTVSAKGVKISNSVRHNLNTND